MAEKKLPTSEQIISRVCRDYGLAKDETESMLLIIRQFESAGSIKNFEERARKRAQIMLALIADFPEERREAIVTVFTVIREFLIEKEKLQLRERTLEPCAH